MDTYASPEPFAEISEDHGGYRLRVNHNKTQSTSLTELTGEQLREIATAITVFLNLES
jgi:hypothetical protein